MAKNGDLCGVCEEGSLTVYSEKNEVEYKGRKANIDSYYSVCDNCGSELTDRELSIINKYLMIDFMESVDRFESMQ